MQLTRGLTWLSALSLIFAMSGSRASAVVADGDVSVSISVTIVPTYTITASAGTGGTVGPAGVVVVLQGDNQTFNITPAAGYRISGVRVDGASVGAVGSYTFNNVGANHTIAATFAALSTNRPPVARDQRLSVRQWSTLKITLSARDPDGDRLTYSIRTKPRHGKLTGSGAKRTYTPAKGYTGRDSFTFRVSDGKGGTDVGKVTITVLRQKQQPKARRGLSRHWVRRRAR